MENLRVNGRRLLSTTLDRFEAELTSSTAYVIKLLVLLILIGDPLTLPLAREMAGSPRTSNYFFHDLLDLFNDSHSKLILLGHPGKLLALVI